MHRLSYSFVLAYHGCELSIGERLLAGEPFRPSDNDYDWLGPGIYFWEANPHRGLEFSREAAQRKRISQPQPFVIGAILDLSYCLDMTTSDGVEHVRTAHDLLMQSTKEAAFTPAANSRDGGLRNLDCAVIRYLHQAREQLELPPIDSVKGVFSEGAPLYSGSGFRAKTHVQIAVRNPLCIKGVFRVPASQLKIL